MSGNTPFCDVTNTGLLVRQDYTTPRVWFGSTALTLPTVNGIAIDAAMFLRACETDSGAVVSIWKSHNLPQGNAILLRDDGAWADLGPTFGNVLIRDAAPNLIVVIQTAVDVYELCSVDALTLEENAPRTSHAMPPTTTISLADVNADLSVIISNPLDTTLNGQPCRFITGERNGVQIAQATGTLPASTLIGGASQAGTLNLGDCNEPHLSANGLFWCARGAGATIYSGPVPSVIPPLVTSGPIVMPTFAPNPALGLVLPDDMLGVKRFTYFNDPMPSAVLDRGFYVEKDANTENWDAQIAQGLVIGRAGNLPLVVNPESTPESVWAITAKQCAAAGVYHVPSIECYPNTTTNVALFVAAATASMRAFGQINFWLAAHNGDGAWAVQDVLNFNAAAWAAIAAQRGLIYSVSLFMRPNQDPAFAKMIAAMMAAATGPDPFPLPILPIPIPPKPVDSGVESLLMSDVPNFIGAITPMPPGQFAGSFGVVSIDGAHILSGQMTGPNGSFNPQWIPGTLETAGPQEVFVKSPSITSGLRALRDDFGAGGNYLVIIG